jgi:hypothetical protein
MHDQENNINLSLLTRTIMNSKKFIILITLFFVAVIVFYALSLKNTYSSSVLLKGKDSYSNQASSSSISSLGSLVGVSFGQGEVDKVGLSIEILKSKDFFETLYKNNDFMINLLAHDIFLPENKQSIYDENLVKILATRYSSNESMDYMNEFYPLELAQIIFLKKLLIFRSVDTGIVKITYTHGSPEVAASSLRVVINELDLYIKNRDLKRSEKALDFLNSSNLFSTTDSIKKVTANLIESELKKIVLSSIDENYIFDVIDSPRISFFKTGPFRSKMAIFAIFAGFVSSILIILTLFYFNKKLHFTIKPPRFHLQDL